MKVKSRCPVIFARFCDALEKSGIRVYTEATGLVEQGNVGMSCFMRADGELLYTDTSSPAPFTFIRNAS
jgi:hypothetical protein